LAGLLSHRRRLNLDPFRVEHHQPSAGQFAHHHQRVRFTTRLIRWGTDGLAFRTSGGQIFLVRATWPMTATPMACRWLELQYFGSLNAPGNGPNDDPDGDGFTNSRKCRAGLNPVVFDPLRFTQSQILPGGSIQLSVLGNFRQQLRFVGQHQPDRLDGDPQIHMYQYPDDCYRLGEHEYRPPLLSRAPLSAVPGPTLRFPSSGGTGNELHHPRARRRPRLRLSGGNSTNLFDWTPLTNLSSTTQRCISRTRPIPTASSTGPSRNKHPQLLTFLSSL